MSKLGYDFIDCPELDYINGKEDEVSVEQLIIALEGILQKYGAKALIRFDAGYNNIGVEVKPSKKVQVSK